MSTGNDAKRENCGSQLIVLANSVSKKAEDLSFSVNERLLSVTTPELPKVAEAPTGSAKNTDVWPPFLNDLRTLLWEIQGNLNNIRNTIDRLEI